MNNSSIFTCESDQNKEMTNNSTITKNGMAAFKSTLNANLDFYSSVVRGASNDAVTNKYSLAFAENKETATKLLCHYRDTTTGFGKGEKLVSYYMLQWIRENYFEYYKTIFEPIILQYGCYNDINKIIDLLNGADSSFEIDVIAKNYTLFFNMILFFYCPIILATFLFLLLIFHFVLLILLFLDM